MRSYNDLINYIYSDRSLNFSKCENLSLVFLKLIRKDIIEDSRNKKWFLESVINIQRSINNVPKIIKNFAKRIEKQRADLEKHGYENIFKNEKDKCLKLKTASRLVVGLGAGHVLETSLTLHHIFGIPYIPGSALKGVVRMVNFWEIVEKLNKKSDEDIEKLQKQLYEDEISNSDKNDFDKKDILKHKLLFGTQKFKGLLVFLDAYPEVQNNQQIFELDVMTPHYQGYYTKNQVPGDWENPNPIPFLTVKKGITFCFNVLFDKFRAERLLTLKDDEFPNQAKGIIKEWFNDNFSKISQDVKKWIEDALTEFGVGAKTRLGYGIFEQ
ncbi:MAG: type III-B CRISPR module RAMP protein Cmr6 [Thermodesulfobacteriaceae bacterium]|jgi:CRISPR-associated protein Cmr6